MTTARWRQAILILLLAVVLVMAVACSAGQPAGTNQPMQDELAALQVQTQQLQMNLTQKEAEIVALSQALSQKETEMQDMKGLVQTLEAQLATAESAIPSPSGSGNSATANTASLVQTGMTVVQLLANADMVQLSTHVHPVAGVRFTPYPYVNPATDIVLATAQVATALTTPVQANWGSQDGTGDPLLMDYAAYHARYVYDQDYANPDVIGIDTVVGDGSMIDNLTVVYPNARFLDFHFNGFDLQFDGMDWRSLRLVFEEVNGVWKLVGIVHGEWTT